MKSGVHAQSVPRWGQTAKPPRKEAINLNIITYGKDERILLAKNELLLEADLQGVSCVHLFPIPTTQNGKTLKGGEEDLSSLGGRIKDGEAAFCYGGAEELKKKSLGRVYDLSDDGAFLEGNAYLTAIAALGYLFYERGFLPDGKRVGIIGFGRIGSAFAKLIAYFGGELTLFTSKKELKDTLFDMGIMSALSFGTGGIARENVMGLDLLVNTAEAPLISPDLKDALEGALVLELASGDNIPREIPHEILHALPTKYFLREAGALYCRRVREILGKISSEGEETVI